MSYKFETRELKIRAVSCIVCGMIALFLGVGALVFMLAARQYLIGGILVVLFVLPIIIWRIIYSNADKNIHKRIKNSSDAITTIAIVEYCKFYKNSKKDGGGKALYLTSILTGEDCGDKLFYRHYISGSQFNRGDFVQIMFIKEQYQDCLVVKKMDFSDYKAQFPQDYWDGYEGDGSDLLVSEEEL